MEESLEEFLLTSFYEILQKTLSTKIPERFWKMLQENLKKFLAVSLEVIVEKILKTYMGRNIFQKNSQNNIWSIFAEVIK